MDSSPTVGMLYDTLDSLVAVKLDLATREAAGLSPVRRARMTQDIDHSIENIRVAIGRLQSRSRCRQEVPD